MASMVSRLQPRFFFQNGTGGPIEPALEDGNDCNIQALPDDDHPFPLFQDRDEAPLTGWT
jgi:hypothetical protein